MASDFTISQLVNARADNANTISEIFKLGQIDERVGGTVGYCEDQSEVIDVVREIEFVTDIVHKVIYVRRRGADKIGGGDQHQSFHYFFFRFGDFWGLLLPGFCFSTGLGIVTLELLFSTAILLLRTIKNMWLYIAMNRAKGTTHVITKTA